MLFPSSLQTSRTLIRAMLRCSPSFLQVFRLEPFDRFLVPFSLPSKLFLLEAGKGTCVAACLIAFSLSSSFFSLLLFPYPVWLGRFNEQERSARAQGCHVRRCSLTPFSFIHLPTFGIKELRLFVGGLSSFIPLSFLGLFPPCIVLFFPTRFYTFLCPQTLYEMGDRNEGREILYPRETVSPEFLFSLAFPPRLFTST